MATKGAKREGWLQYFTWEPVDQNESARLFCAVGRGSQAKWRARARLKSIMIAELTVIVLI